MPAYAAYEKDFFEDVGLEVSLAIEPTAWQVPQKLAGGLSQFAVMPWTRVAAAGKEMPLVLLCGSGFEEAAIVVRKGVDVAGVRSVAIPQQGGIKDLTAMGLIHELGWTDVEIIRQPSGDGAIIAFFGRGVDAASMVEPYATMLECLGVGTVVKRTGDLWKGAPGCSLTTTDALRRSEPELVQRVVNAFVRGSNFVREEPEESAEMARRYIGIKAGYIREALRVNQPDVDAIRNTDAMEAILRLMMELGYIHQIPAGYSDLTFLDEAAAALEG
jgi:ABC-type nitrate/sulfonate/bicarbonate transport system substrate-binding protein